MTIANVGLLNTFTVLSNKFLDLIVKETAPLDIYTLDFTSDVAQFGSSVVTHLPGELTGQTKVTTGSYADNSFAFTPYTTTLDSQVYAQINISEQDLMKSPIKDLEQRILFPLTYALAKKIEDAAFAHILASYFTTTATVAASGFNVASIANLNTTARVLGWRQNDKWNLLAPGTYLNQLMQQQAVVQSFRSDVNTAMVEGQVGKLFNFNLHDNERIPANGINLAAFAVRQQAVLILARALPEISNFYGAVKTMTAENGLPVRFTMYYDPSAGNYIYRAESLIGTSKGDPKALIPILSA